MEVTHIGDHNGISVFTDGKAPYITRESAIEMYCLVMANFHQCMYFEVDTSPADQLSPIGASDNDLIKLSSLRRLCSEAQPNSVMDIFDNITEMLIEWQSKRIATCERKINEILVRLDNHGVASYESYAV